jgi:hypothetical protein
MKAAITIAGLGVALSLLLVSSPADARYCSMQAYDCGTDGTFFVAANHVTASDAANYVAGGLEGCTRTSLFTSIPEVGCAEVLLDDYLMSDLYCGEGDRAPGTANDRCGSNFEIEAIDLGDLCVAYDIVLYNAWDNWSYQLKTVAGACP